MGNGQLGTMYVNTSGDSNQLVLNSLQECVQYNISVRAYTSQGPGLFSSSVLDSSLNSESTIVFRVHITSNPFYHDPQCMLKSHNHQRFRPVHSMLPLPILPGAVLWKKTTQSSHILLMSLRMTPVLLVQTVHVDEILVTTQQFPDIRGTFN